MKHSTSTLDRPRGDRDNAVGLVRFVLSSLVILSHSFHFYGKSHEYDPMVRLSWGQYTTGRVAVDAFFVLSGFLVARSWDGCRNWADFLARRASRVYPGFFASVAFSSFIAAPWLVSQGLADTAPKTWAGLILPALAMDFRNLAVNGSLWTIQYDFYYYLLLSLIGSAGWLAMRWPVMALWAASWAVYAVWHAAGVEAGVEAQHPRLLTCFLAGAVCYAYRDRLPLSWLWFAVALTGLLTFAGGMWTYRQWPYRVMSPAFPVFGSYVLLFIAFRPGRIAAKLGWLGNYSYGLFLYSFPIQLMLFVAYRPRLNPLTLFLASWVIACAFAHLSFRLIDRPVSARFRRRPTAGRIPPPSPHFPALELEEAREAAPA